MTIAEKTGWSYNEILEKRAWINIKMMLADAAGVKKVKKQPKQLTSEEFARMMGV